MYVANRGHDTIAVFAVGANLESDPQAPLQLIGRARIIFAPTFRSMPMANTWPGAGRPDPSGVIGNFLAISAVRYLQIPWHHPLLPSCGKRAALGPLQHERPHPAQLLHRQVCRYFRDCFRDKTELRAGPAGSSWCVTRSQTRSSRSSSMATQACCAQQAILRMLAARLV